MSSSPFVILCSNITTNAVSILDSVIDPESFEFLQGKHTRTFAFRTKHGRFPTRPGYEPAEARGSTPIGNDSHLCYAPKISLGRISP